MLRWGSDFTPNNWDEWSELLSGTEQDLPVLRYDYQYRSDEPDPDWHWLYLPTSIAYDTLFPPFISKELLEQNDPVWMPAQAD